MAPSDRLTGATAGPPPHGPRRRRAPRRWRWALAALLLVPLAEIAVIVATSRAVGAWWTILLLLAMTALGVVLVRREGRRTWDALRRALHSGRMPGEQLLDAGLVLVGGLLLLVPGFLTDLTGLLLVLPWSRPLGRRGLAALVGSRALGGAVPPWPAGGRGFGRPRTDDDVIEGEIIDDDPPGSDTGTR